MPSKFEKVKVVYIPLSCLAPHPRVQRRLKQRHVDRLAASFDPELFGCLKVVPGRVVAGVQHYYVVDGQHRLMAALAWLGDDTQSVPCRVSHARNDAEAAEAFIGANTGMALKSIDLFMQRVIAREDVAVAVNAVVEGAGLVIGYGGSGAVTASSSCERLYRKAGGAEALTRSLTILREAWNGRRNAYHQSLIGGLGDLILEHGDRVADAELSAKLKRKGLPDDFIGEARSRARTLRMMLPTAVKQTLVAEYNAGRRSHRLPVAA
jgi:hypothetical protein